MLKIENLKKDYKDFNLDCSLRVMPGRITGLIGQNGAGMLGAHNTGSNKFSMITASGS